MLVLICFAEQGNKWSLTSLVWAGGGEMQIFTLSAHRMFPERWHSWRGLRFAGMIESHSSRSRSAVAQSIAGVCLQGVHAGVQMVALTPANNAEARVETAA